MKKIIMFILCLICLASFASAKSLPDLTLALGDGGPATDVLLLTQIIQYLGEDGYDNLPQGITKVFSQIDSLDEKVTIVIYEGEVEIIVGEGSPSSYSDFAEDLADILDDHDIINKITSYDELETEDLLELYDIVLEEDGEVECISCCKTDNDCIDWFGAGFTCKDAICEEPIIIENKTEEIVPEPELILEAEPVVIEKPSLISKVIEWFKGLF
jgi:hypothetical protein